MVSMGFLCIDYDFYIYIYVKIKTPVHLQCYKNIHSSLSKAG